MNIIANIQFYCPSGLAGIVRVYLCLLFKIRKLWFIWEMNLILASFSHKNVRKIIIYIFKPTLISLYLWLLCSFITIPFFRFTELQISVKNIRLKEWYWKSRSKHSFQISATPETLFFKILNVRKRQKIGCFPALLYGQLQIQYCVKYCLWSFACLAMFKFLIAHWWSH
jgi:hypothetical protein